MQAYDTAADAVPTQGPDAFGASRAAFEALAGTLGAHQAAGWTCDQLEDHVQAHGRELLRLLLQDHLDLRAAREQHACQQQQDRGVSDAEGVPHRKGGAWSRPPPGHGVRHGAGDPLRLARRRRAQPVSR